MTTVIKPHGKLSAGTYKVVGIIGDTRGLRTVAIGCGFSNGCDTNHNPFDMNLVNSMSLTGWYKSPTCAVFEHGTLTRNEPFKVCDGSFLMVRSNKSEYDPTEDVSVVVVTEK